MKQILLGLSLVMITLVCSGDQPSDTELAAAKVAIGELAGALQSELKTAMQAGGPVAAIGVCNTRAMPITEKVAVGQGLQLSRVSLKNRNPANLPNEWQTAVLNEFQKKQAEGKEVGSLVWSDTINVEGEKEFRFMKAIPTSAVCLSCHGTDLSPEVSGVLAALYPEDLATGYYEGDIRGAFVATRKYSD